MFYSKIKKILTIIWYNLTILGGAILLKFKLFIPLLFTLLFLVGCGSDNEKILEEVNAEIEQEQELVNLFNEKKYDEIIDIVVKQENELHTNFFNIALAYKDKDRIDETNKEFLYMHTKDMKSILIKLDKVTNPPQAIAEEVERTRNLVEQMFNKTLLDDPSTDNSSSATLKTPTIGMTKEEVIYSQWGKPIDINRTITSSYTKEQWVYPGYKYLYFEDNILVTIQD